jgi:hypothetical protein
VPSDHRRLLALLERIAAGSPRDLAILAVIEANRVIAYGPVEAAASPTLLHRNGRSRAYPTLAVAISDIRHSIRGQHRTIEAGADTIQLREARA